MRQYKMYLYTSIYASDFASRMAVIIVELIVEILLNAVAEKTWAAAIAALSLEGGSPAALAAGIIFADSSPDILLERMAE